MIVSKQKKLVGRPVYIVDGARTPFIKAKGKRGRDTVDGRLEKSGEVEACGANNPSMGSVAFLISGDDNRAFVSRLSVRFLVGRAPTRPK